MSVSDGAWRWWQRFRAIFRSSDVEREIQDEMAMHLEMEIHSRVEQGMSPEEARRSARIDFGSIENHRAASRDVRFGHRLEQVASDLRLATRRLASAPGFAVIAVLTIAVGIGAATAIWSLAQETLFPELPYDEAERVMRIRTMYSGKDGHVSPAELFDYQSRLGHVFSDVGGYTISTANLAGESGPRKVPAAGMTHGALEALGLEPALGRRFTLEEDRTGADVVIVSHTLWTSELGADQRAVGRTLSLDSKPFEVIGVLPAGAELPDTLQGGPRVDLFAPLGIQPSNVTTRGSHFLEAYGRLLPGVAPEQGATEVAALGRAFVDEYPLEYAEGMGFALDADELTLWLRQPFLQPMAVLAGAVAFLLLVAFANVAGLLLARTEERSRELAMRAALGAGIRRLAQQLAVENSLLALLGGALGVVLGRSLLLALAGWLPPAQSHLIDPTLDLTLLSAALALAVLGSLTFGLLPLLHLRGTRPQSALRSVRTLTAGAGGRRLRQSLMVTQVAVAVTLLSVAGLLGRSFVRLLDVDPGYRTESLVTTQVSLPFAGYGETEATLAFWQRLVEEVESRPGVHGVSAAVYLVLAGPVGDMGFDVVGRETPEGLDKPDADWQVVMPGYFDLLDIELEAGRPLDERDSAGATGAVVINRTFVERTFPDAASPGDVIGQRIALGGEQTQPSVATIVGVIPDIRHGSLDAKRQPHMYFSHQQFRFWSNGQPLRSMNLLVDSALAPDATRQLLEDAVHTLDPTLPLSQMRTLEQVRHSSITLPRFLAAILLTFAGATLFLTVVGLYGVVSETVVKRLPELGVRRALGARAADLSRLVVGEGVRLFATGLVLGAVLTSLAASGLRGLLFETSPAEPLTHLLVVAVLFAAVLAACALPAARAARVDPSKLMRLE